jgi:UDP-glucose 4-epimerase
MKIKKILITGVAGFIGSNYCEYLLKKFNKIRIIGIDNFSVGNKKNIKEFLLNKNFEFHKLDIHDLKKIIKISKNCSLVIHLASNADIAKAIKNPLIDYTQGFKLTLNILEVMRKNSIKNLIFSSGSGVYKESYNKKLIENKTDLIPISTYGANKLSSEAFISAYCHLFDIKASIFRFANVVGKKQTHGVAYDFKKKLIKNPKFIKVMGNGNQRKSYIDVEDVISGTILAFHNQKKKFSIYNIANDDQISVKEILNLVVKKLDIDYPKVKWGKHNRGWLGDVPFVKLSNKKIKAIGWTYKFNTKQAIINSLKFI